MEICQNGGLVWFVQKWQEIKNKSFSQCPSTNTAMRMTFSEVGQTAETHSVLSKKHVKVGQYILIFRLAYGIIGLRWIVSNRTKKNKSPKSWSLEPRERVLFINLKWDQSHWAPPLLASADLLHRTEASPEMEPMFQRELEPLWKFNKEVQVEKH